MRALRVTLLLLACAFATGAAAQYPDKPVRLIVPQAAGSATDTVARILGAELGKELGQQIVIDNRPGGALTIGLDLTAKAEPDGYTICMGPIGALAITRHMVAKLPYDIERDFQPIALATRGHLLLAVSPTLPFKSVQEVIDYAKDNPGKLLNASSSNGSPGHVGGELFKYMTATDILHVPYKGGAQAINDLIAGHVDLMFESLNGISSAAKSSQVRPLAVSAYNVQAYLFQDYWEDIGTIEAFYHANLALTAQPEPLFSFYDEQAPIYTRSRYLPPTKLLDAQVRESMLGEGCILKECTVTRSVIGLRSRIDTGCVIEEALVMGADYYESPSQRVEHSEQGTVPLGVGAHTTISKAIVDKNARIGRQVRIVNQDHVQEANQEDLGFVIRNGIVVVIKNATIPDGMVI